MIQVDFCNQSGQPVDQRQLIAAVMGVLADSDVSRAQVSLAVVDDPTIHELNRRHLEHDYPTDVLSFVLEAAEDGLEGEVIVSMDTARQQAAEYGWAPENELLLYVIHGALHLVGYDDKTDLGRREMRAAEAKQLAKYGLTPPWDDEGSSAEPKEA